MERGAEGGPVDRIEKGLWIVLAAVNEPERTGRGAQGHGLQSAITARGDIAERPCRAEQPALARVDVESGARQDFSFGPDFYVGEPVVAPDPDAPLTEDRGWVLLEVLDGKAGKSFLAVFEAGHIEDGPVAKLKLGEHLPMSFHGWWQPA